jgi:hypothetical protein
LQLLFMQLQPPFACWFWCLVAHLCLQLQYNPLVCF